MNKINVHKYTYDKDVGINNCILKCVSITSLYFTIQAIWNTFENILTFDSLKKILQHSIKIESQLQCL